MYKSLPESYCKGEQAHADNLPEKANPYNEVTDRINWGFWRLGWRDRDDIMERHAEERK